MANIVTSDEVRVVSGATTSLISDEYIQNNISLSQSNTEKMFEIKLFPTKTIETLTGEFKTKILVDEYYPLTVYKVLNGSTEIDLKNIYVNTEQGFLEFYGDSITGGFGFPYSTTRFSPYDLDIKVKYLYGMVQKDTTITTDTSAALSSGSSVSIEVLDSSKFNVNDYVFIEDTNRAKEVFKITSIADSTHITAEILVNDYESDAIITKATTHDLFKQYVLYDTAYTVANHIVGNTSNLATGYTFPEYSVQKGVAYTHWSNARDNLKKQRDEIKSRINKLLGTLV